MAMQEGPSVSKLMSTDPVTLPANTPLVQAAQCMRDSFIGDVLLTSREGKVCGIITDRDIAIRCVAEEQDLSTVRAGDVCTTGVVSVTPDTSAQEAANLMREKAIRRLPVIDDSGKLCGVVSIGDLAEELDPHSALAIISTAAPNN